MVWARLKAGGLFSIGMSKIEVPWKKRTVRIRQRVHLERLPPNLPGPFIQEVFIWSELEALLNGLPAPSSYHRHSAWSSQQHRWHLTNAFCMSKYLFSVRKMFVCINRKSAKDWLNQELFLPCEQSRNKWNRVYVGAQGCHLEVKFLPVSISITPSI